MPELVRPILYIMRDVVDLIVKSGTKNAEGFLLFLSV